MLAAVNCLRMPEAISFQESRMSGNPLVRFDEGRVGRSFISSYIPVALSPTLPYRLYRYAKVSQPVNLQNGRIYHPL
jgi:hypothetical protein